MFDLLIPFHTVFCDEGVDQRGFAGLFGAVDEAAAVLFGGGGELLRCAVEGGEAFALVDVVAALFMQGDAGGKVQRVALLLAAGPSRTLAEPIFSASLATM